MMIMKAEKICREFKSGSNIVRALKDVDVTVEAAKLNMLRGRSGSGKTTLMNIMGGLDEPTSGRVWFGDECITDMSKRKRDMLRCRDIGFVFQSVALMPQMTAYENVEYMLRIAGLGVDKERVNYCLDRVGLTARAHHFPAELSGGEQQRVAIARAMVHKPKLIFADEPTAELDSAMGLKVIKLFKELVSDGETILMTTHDTNIMELADTIYTLEDGAIVDFSAGGEQA